MYTTVVSLEAEDAQYKAKENEQQQNEISRLFLIICSLVCRNSQPRK